MINDEIMAIFRILFALIFLLAIVSIALVLVGSIIRNQEQYNKRKAIAAYYDNKQCANDDCNSPALECREYCYDKEREKDVRSLPCR